MLVLLFAVCLHFRSIPCDPTADAHTLKMETKPTPSSYSSKREQQLLLELYEARRDILEDKRTEFSLKGKLKKAEAWQSIEKEYNLAALGPQKNVAQLKRMWQHMKGRAKQEYIREKKEAMRTGGGLPKPEEGTATPTTIRILSTISQELESGGSDWDSDALPSISNCGIDHHQVADEAVIIVEPGSTQQFVPPATPPGTSTTEPVHPAPLVPPATPPSSSQPAHTVTPATSFTRKRKATRTSVTPQEAAIEEFIVYRRQEHEMDMKLKEIEMKIKQKELELKDKDAQLKVADLKLKEMELKIKEKEYKIKEKYLENLSL